MNVKVVLLVTLAVIIIISAVLYFVMDPFAADDSSVPVQEKKQTTSAPVEKSRVTDEPAAETEKPKKSKKEVKTPAQKSPELEEGYYIVKKGDTLESIAEEFLDDKELWLKIFVANESVIDYWDEIYVGQKLIIPEQ